MMCPQQEVIVPTSTARRTFLRDVFGGLGAAGLAGASLAARDAQPAAVAGTRGSIRITKLETFLVRPRWLFLKVHTDEGIVGLGEPVVEGRALTVATAVKEIEPYLVGKDARRVAITGRRSIATRSIEAGPS
jgi:galactonate dehydratase